MLENLECEMVWLFYAGLTNLNQVCIEEVVPKHNIALIQLQHSIILPTQSLKKLVKAWKQCHTYYMDMVTKFGTETLLPLILCCYEAKNSKACRVVVEHLYADKVYTVNNKSSAVQNFCDFRRFSIKRESFVH